MWVATPIIEANNQFIDITKAYQIMEALELLDIREKLYTDLSGGQKTAGPNQSSLSQLEYQTDYEKIVLLMNLRLAYWRYQIQVLSLARNLSTKQLPYLHCNS